MTILKRVEGEFPQEGAGAPGGRTRALSERFEPRENRTVGVSASRRALERGSYLAAGSEVGFCSVLLDSHSP